MRIYFSGIGGVGIGPLAQIAKDMGHDVIGSDLHESRLVELIRSSGIKVLIGQDGSQIAQAQAEAPIDWLVHSSALTPDNPELIFAKDNNIRTSKRDELLNQIVTDKHLKLVAVAGTHGKTTTTAMLIWLFKQLGIKVSYSVGTDISFGPNGQYIDGSEYFIYEADEYDRNFLQFQPYISIIPSVDYDHQDIYPTKLDYIQAFGDFILATHCTYIWRSDAEYLGLTNNACVHILGADERTDKIKLKGAQNRRNAWLALSAVSHLLSNVNPSELIKILSDFPGVGRRFEQIAPNIISDYAHHPAEIAATIAQAREVNKHVIGVYQPHQNSRQHQIKADYHDTFKGLERLYWLPTYLSREDPDLPTLTPDDFIKDLSNNEIAESAEMNDQLKATLKQLASEGSLVLLMSAGSLDEWARQELV